MTNDQRADLLFSVAGSFDADKFYHPESDSDDYYWCTAYSSVIDTMSGEVFTYDPEGVDPLADKLPAGVSLIAKLDRDLVQVASDMVASINNKLRQIDDKRTA